MTAAEKETIYGIFFDYYQKNKYADKNFISSILHVIIKENNYEKYVRKIRYYMSVIDKKMGSYSFFYKKMCFYMPEKNMSVIDYNILMLRTIMHESTHISQYDKIINGKNDIKRIILKEDLGDQLLDLSIYDKNLYYLPLDKLQKINEERSYYEKKNQLYYSLYDYSPSERMAEIESLLKTITVVNSIDDERLTRKKETLQRYCYQFLIRKYGKDLSGPTITWYKKLQSLAPQMERLFISPQVIEDKSKNMSFENRIYLGLPVNQFEYKTVQLKAKLL